MAFETFINNITTVSPKTPLIHWSLWRMRDVIDGWKVRPYDDENMIKDDWSHYRIHTVISDCVINDGVINDDVINDGVISDGVIDDGVISDSVINDGVINDGVIDDGVINDGIINDGVII